MKNNGDRLPLAEINVDVGPMAAREALAALKSRLSITDATEEDLSTVELVMAEVLNNIVEHAHDDAKKRGSICISCSHGENDLFLTVVDQGEPMPGGIVPAGQEQDLDVDLMDLPEGGFGWFLIQDLTESLSYERIGAENRLSLHFRLGRA